MGLVQVATNTVTSAVASVTLTGIDSDDVYMVAVNNVTLNTSGSDSFEVIDKSFSAILIEISSPSIAQGPAISKNLSFGISFKIIFNINYYFLFTSKNFPPSHLYTCPSNFKMRL